MGAAGGSGKDGGGNFLFYGDSHSLIPGDFELRSGQGIFCGWDESAGILTFGSGIGEPKWRYGCIDTQGYWRHRSR